MKKITLIFSLLFTVVFFAQQSFTYQLDSYELGESRELRIYLPPSYEENTEQYYPLAVVLDAEYLFDVYVGNSILFSQKDKAPEQIIVGINQRGKRHQDCEFNELNGLPIEKGDLFYRFVRSELLNYMEENYRVSPFRTVIGNTVTGNFINYFFIEDSPGFNAFINVNPYYAPEMGFLIEKNAQKVSKNSYYYYLASGDYNSEKRKTVISSVNNTLSSINNEKFNYKFDDLSGATTVSSIGRSIPSAFAFIFEIYSSISKKEFNDNIKGLTPSDAIAYLENKYVDIEYLFGSNLKIRERDIYAIEGIVIDKENGEYLRDFGEMIYKLYPESPLSDYYIGLDFELRGKFKRALEAYKEGYMKFVGDNEGAENFYQNVERVAKKVN